MGVNKDKFSNLSTIADLQLPDKMVHSRHSPYEPIPINHKV